MRVHLTLFPMMEVARGFPISFPGFLGPGFWGKYRNQTLPSPSKLTPEHLGPPAGDRRPPKAAWAATKALAHSHRTGWEDREKPVHTQIAVWLQRGVTRRNQPLCMIGRMIGAPTFLGCKSSTRKQEDPGSTRST